nr:MAG TPA: hypothetical protein [Bacteriophage sp.]
MFRMPPSFRSVSSVAFGAHCLMSVKDHAAAWRARPSGPDVWADALVRRISPLLPPRTRADKEGKKKYGIRLYPRKNVPCLLVCCTYSFLPSLLYHNILCL